MFLENKTMINACKKNLKGSRTKFKCVRIFDFYNFFEIFIKRNDARYDD